MGNSRSSLQLQPEDITAIQDETGFNQNQIERLYSRSVTQHRTLSCSPSHWSTKVLLLSGRFHYLTPLAWRGERKRSNKSQVLLLRLKVMPILYTDTEPKMNSVHGKDSIAHVIGTFPSGFMCTENVVLF